MKTHIFRRTVITFMVCALAASLVFVPGVRTLLAEPKMPVFEVTLLEEASVSMAQQKVSYGTAGSSLKPLESNRPQTARKGDAVVVDDRGQAGSQSTAMRWPCIFITTRKSRPPICPPPSRRRWALQQVQNPGAIPLLQLKLVLGTMFGSSLGKSRPRVASKCTC